MRQRYRGFSKKVETDKKSLSENSLLASADADLQLYPSILHELGLETLENAIEKRIQVDLHLRSHYAG